VLVRRLVREGVLRTAGGATTAGGASTASG